MYLSDLTWQMIQRDPGAQAKILLVMATVVATWIAIIMVIRIPLVRQSLDNVAAASRKSLQETDQTRRKAA
jgi:hypothetical protein